MMLMSLKYSSMFLLSTVTMLKLMNKKIMVLLSLEMIMLTMVPILTMKISSSYFSGIMIIMISIIMVTESVLGMTIIIVQSRETDKLSSMFYTWN